MRFLAEFCELTAEAADSRCEASGSGISVGTFERQDVELHGVGALLSKHYVARGAAFRKDIPGPRVSILERVFARTESVVRLQPQAKRER